MKQWFKVSIRYAKMNENRKEVKTTESYLVDSISFTDCELKIIEKMKEEISGLFEVNSIQRKNYAEIIGANKSINMVDSEANKIMGINQNQSKEADKWFDCKVSFIAYDEIKSVEKKTSVMYLVNANSVNSANDTIIDSLSGMLSDYVIERIADSKIIDVLITD